MILYMEKPNKIPRACIIAVRTVPTVINWLHAYASHDIYTLLIYK